MKKEGGRNLVNLGKEEKQVKKFRLDCIHFPGSYFNVSSKCLKCGTRNQEEKEILLTFIGSNERKERTGKREGGRLHTRNEIGGGGKYLLAAKKRRVGSRRTS